MKSKMSTTHRTRQGWMPGGVYMKSFVFALVIVIAVSIPVLDSSQTVLSLTQGEPSAFTIANSGEVTSTDIDWVQMTPISSPPATFSPALAYDSARRRVVLFGGGIVGTWEYDGTTWVEKPTPASMPHRGGHAMVYDSSRGRIVLFGGGQSISSSLNDTWEYDGTSWVEKSPVTRPPARLRHAMAYDSARRRVVLFGGISRDGAELADTWEYDGTNWIQIRPNTHPYARADHAMVYDSDRGRVILHGGGNYSQSIVFADTWEYDGTTWQLKRVADSPRYLADHAMAYDSKRHRAVLFGGRHPIWYTRYADTWEYDGVTWVQIATTNSPPARYDHAMAYDSTRGRIVLFGGSSGFMGTTFNDTWEYYAPPPANDDFDHASLFPELPPNGLAPQVLSTGPIDATVAPDDPDMGCGTGVNSHTIWYKLIPHHYGRVRIRTYSTLDPAASSDYDTVVAVFTGQRGSLNRIACNNDAPGHEPLSDLTFEADAERTYYVEVASYDDSPGGTLSLFINYELSPKAWTLMFYFAGDNDLSEALRWERITLDEAGKRNLNVNLVALWDDDESGSEYLIFTPWGRQRILQSEINTGDPLTLKNFYIWAINEYPANHYALIIVNHGHGLSGTSIDKHSNDDWLTIKETRDALMAVFPKPDLIYTHACLMANLESAYELVAQARYYIASESQVWAARLDYFITGMMAHISEVPPIRSDTSPLALARSIAQSYTFQQKYARGGIQPSTISVVDLSHISAVAFAASDLAHRLRSNFPGIIPALSGIWQDVQRFDEARLLDGGAITLFDAVADLYHFADLVRTRVDNPEIDIAAGSLISAINRAVVFNEVWSGYPQNKNFYWNHGNGHGISVLLPVLMRPCYYTGDWLDFASGTYWNCKGLETSKSSTSTITLEWGPMLVEYLDQTNPSAPEELNPPVPVPMLTSYSVYTPLVLRQFGSTPPSAPTIRVEPTSGPLGTRFNIYGSGFVPGESVQQWVILPGGDRFDDPTPETVDSQGNYISWIQIVDGPAGTYTLYARGNQSQQTVSTQFQITSSSAGGVEISQVSQIAWGR